MIIQVLGTKWGRERPKITLIVIKDDMLIKEVKKTYDFGNDRTAEKNKCGWTPLVC